MAPVSVPDHMTALALCQASSSNPVSQSASPTDFQSWLAASEHRSPEACFREWDFILPLNIYVITAFWNQLAIDLAWGAVLRMEPGGLCVQGRATMERQPQPSSSLPLFVLK